MFPRFSCKYLGFTVYFSDAHKAVDIASAITTSNGKCYNEYAYIVVNNAKVLKNEYASDYGWFVEYETTAPNGDKYVFASGHFLEKSELIVGNIYNVGDIAGKIGSTGKSGGPHDHFRISINGTRVDPLQHCYAYNDWNVISIYEKSNIKIYDSSLEPTPTTPTQDSYINISGIVELYDITGTKYEYPSTTTKDVKDLGKVEINGEQFIKIQHESFNPNIVYIREGSKKYYNLVGTVPLYDANGNKYANDSTTNKKVEILDEVYINGEKYYKIFYLGFNPNTVYVKV